jgi:predicted DNA-binding transcriptional regulator AlpA
VDQAFYSWDDVIRILELSRPTVWRAIRDNRFQRKPRQLMTRRVGFLKSEVDEWIANRPTGTAYNGATATGQPLAAAKG